MQEIFQKFPPQNESDLFDLLQFVKKAPLAKDHWMILKSLYKQTEQAFLAKPNPYLSKLLARLMMRLDQGNMQQLDSPYPTKATLRYMKRRARRCLQQMAQQEPNEYFNIASQILLANEDQDKIYFDYQWLSADIILGNSRRCQQINKSQGSYVFEYLNYHLNHIEEKQVGIWEENIPFLHKLLSLKMPWEICEFALKILERNKIALPDLPEDLLTRFFLSPSIHLKRIATQVCYQSFQEQGLSPELYAGMWLYSAPIQQKEIEAILKKRPILPNTWHWAMGLSLWKYSFQELAMGNNKRRILGSINLLIKEYPHAFEDADLLPIAQTLFQSSHADLQELAFQGIQNAPKEKAWEWLNAYGLTEKPEDIQAQDTYERICEVLLSKFPNKLQFNEVEPFIYNSSYAIAEFGWRLSERLHEKYSLYTIWYNLTNYPNNRRFKEIYFYHAITSTYGAQAFIKHYKEYKYRFFYTPVEIISLIFAHAQSSIQKFVIKITKEQFISAPLYNLTRLSMVPSPYRDDILAQAIPKFKNQNIFGRHWQLGHLLRNAINDTWMQEAVFLMLANCRLDRQDVKPLFEVILNYEAFAQRFFEFFDKLETKQKALFMDVISQDISFIYLNARIIPRDMIYEALSKMDLDSLLGITQNADENNWTILQQGVYSHLLEKQTETNFWKTILSKIQDSEDSTLRVRLIENETFFQFFLEQKDSSVLQLTYPELENLLLQWSQNHPELFQMDTAPLREVCLHKLPKLRQWGLSQAQSQGLSLIFALQLMESDLPEAIHVAQAHFNQLVKGSNQELEAVLMLCDSPNAQVRTFGLQYLKTRKEHFANPTQVLECLSEHADQRIQTFVAQALAENTVEANFVKRFDTELLRMKNRARQAKESIKSRVEKELHLDAATLLEIARSQQKGDAEWAIEQLTKMALAGETIEGFELE